MADMSRGLAEPEAKKQEGKSKRRKEKAKENRKIATGELIKGLKKVETRLKKS